MKTTLALVAAMSALLVSVINLVNGILDRRHRRSSEREVALLKSQLEEQSRRRVERERILRDTAELLRDGVALIQRARDTIHLVTDAVAGSLESQAALSLMISDRDQLAGAFARARAYLEPNEDKAFHAAKKDAGLAAGILTNLVAVAPYCDEMSRDQRGQLLELRQALADSQHVLMTGCTERLVMAFVLPTTAPFSA